MLQRLGSDQEWCGWYGHFGPDQYSSSAPLKTTEMVALAGGRGQGCVYHALPLSALSGRAFLPSTLEKSLGERDIQQFPQAIEEYYFLSALMCRPPPRYLNPQLLEFTCNMRAGQLCSKCSLASSGLNGGFKFYIGKLRIIVAALLISQCYYMYKMWK